MCAGVGNSGGSDIILAKVGARLEAVVVARSKALSENDDDDGGDGGSGTNGSKLVEADVGNTATAGTATDGFVKWISSNESASSSRAELTRSSVESTWSYTSSVLESLSKRTSSSGPSSGLSMWLSMSDDTILRSSSRCWSLARTSGGRKLPLCCRCPDDDDEDDDEYEVEELEEEVDDE